MKKRTAACIALAALTVCLFVAPALAEQTERKVMLGTSGLARYDSVYLGSHSGDSFGCMMNQPCHSGTAVKWHIFPLEVFDEQVEDETRLALFSQCVFGERSEGESHVWFMTSVGDANAFVQKLPEKMFTGVERSAVPSLLSPNPFYNYTNSVPSNIAGIGKRYWSDSEEYDDYRRGKYFDETGTMYTEDEKYYSASAGARPWGALNDESVLFISKAQGGKSLENASTGFVSNAEQEIDTWRFTLKDQARSGFAITSAELNGNQVTVNYTGAKTGANEYISAIITDGDSDILYYGRMKQLAYAADASGEVEITCPDGIALGRRLYVFSEQYNGGENDQSLQTDYASDLCLVNLDVSFDTQMVVKPNYTDLDIQATDLGKNPELNTVAKIDAHLRMDLAQKGAVSDTAVLYDVILQYTDADGEWKDACQEHFPEDGIEVVLPAVKGTTPATHVYKIAHMFTMGSRAGDVEYPVPVAYQNEEGAWMLKFTVNGFSPIMVAAVPIPEAPPQTGDTSDVRLYAMLLAISVMGIAAAKRRRSE